MRYINTIAGPTYGITSTYGDFATTDITALLTSQPTTTKMIWIESPSNPLLKVLDISSRKSLKNQKTKRRKRPMSASAVTDGQPSSQPLLKLPSSLNLLAVQVTAVHVFLSEHVSHVP